MKQLTSFKSIQQEDASQTLDSLMEGMCEVFGTVLPEQSAGGRPKGAPCLNIGLAQANANFLVCSSSSSMPLLDHIVTYWIRS